VAGSEQIKQLTRQISELRAELLAGRSPSVVPPAGATGSLAESEE
jgi:hypothetical protein